MTDISPEAVERLARTAEFGMHHVAAATLRAQAARIAELEENEDRFVDGIKAVRQYGSDTLTGPTNNSDDTRDWQRASVIEMTKRCRLLLSGHNWDAEDDCSTPDEVAIKTEVQL